MLTLTCLQDLTVHTREVHSKLVEIMQDRLLLAARQLAAEARGWGVVYQHSGGRPSGGGAGAAASTAANFDFEVSPAVRSLSKQLATLQSVLVPILQEEEVRGYAHVPNFNMTFPLLRCACPSSWPRSSCCWC